MDLYNDQIIIDECCICLELLQGELVEISCGHIYHYNCIKNWINNKNKIRKICCICEQETEIINIFYKINTHLYKKPKKNAQDIQLIRPIQLNEYQPIQNRNENYNCCKIL